MACKSSGRVYTVRCLRHRHHEYSLPASVPDEEDQEKADRARALETLRREKEEQERADRQRALEIVAANMKVYLFASIVLLVFCCVRHVALMDEPG